MKYLPLIWAGLWRKPARTILTLLSVTVAFVLFGLMIGLNAGFAHLVDIARADRISVNPRFGGQLPVSERDQIARLDGVTTVAYNGFLFGYYQDLKNFTYAFMIEPEAQHVWTELPISPQQYQQLFASRTGIIISRFIANRFARKAGDTLPIQTSEPWREDGARVWTFNILDVVDDVPDFPAGFILGNYSYFDQARLMKDRGKVNQFTVLVKDPSTAVATSHAIDKLFANSDGPTRSISEKVARQGGTGIIDVAFVTQAIAAAGLFMILFLTGNAIAQSVRERISEFAVLRTLGFSTTGVMAVILTEAAIPCLMGAALGLGIATALSPFSTALMPPGWGLPLPLLSPAVLASAFGAAVLVAFASAVLPALKINRLDVAATLSGR